MSKSIILDFVILKKLDLLITDFLYLAWLNDKKYLNSLHDYFCNYNNIKVQEKKYIKVNDKGEIQLRQSALDLLSYLSIDSFKEFNAPKIIKKSSKKIKAEVVERIEDYRKLWSGRKAGSMGDKSSCITKLSRWMETNPEYSFEDILKAAQLYLDTESNVQYLQRADYFIYKQEANKDETSRLSAYIDEARTNDFTNSSWTTALN